MSESLPAGVTEVDLFRLVRSQIEFEDGLITQRLSWFVAAQSFLFTAYAINLNGPPMVAGSGVWRQHGLLSQLVPVVAIASGALIYCGIVAGVVAQRRLRSYLSKRISGMELASLPGIHGSLGTRVFGMAAPLGLPPVFVTVWIVLFVRGLMM